MGAVSSRPPCPLCGGEATAQSGPEQCFYVCGVCQLAYRAREDFPTKEAEKAIYDLHENDPEDIGYRNFLERCAGPLRKRVSQSAEGLDYGSGPGPAMPRLLAPRTVALYDPFYAPQREVLRRQFDFVVCTETAEHFQDPASSWQELFSLLRPSGLLAVMTRVRPAVEALPQWNYARDPTHVCLYAAATFQWLAQWSGSDLDRPHPDVAIFQLQDRFSG